MRAKEASMVHADKFKGGGGNIEYYYLLLPIIAAEGPMSETGTHSSAQASQTLCEESICRPWSIMCGPLMSPQSFPAVP